MWKLRDVAQAASAAGIGFGGSRLIGEGPDGRGGTTRFPLTSSYAMNQQQVGVNCVSLQPAIPSRFCMNRCAGVLYDRK
jgi:hypothetical protein